MKQRFYIGLTMATIFVMIGGLATRYISTRQRLAEARKAAVIVQAYNEQMLSLYQKRAALIEEVLKVTGKQDYQTQAVLLHTKAWHASSLGDIQEIEEVNSYLDTHFSNFLVSLASQKIEGIRTQMREMQELNRSINQFKKSNLDYSL